MNADSCVRIHELTDVNLGKCALQFQSGWKWPGRMEMCVNFGWKLPSNVFQSSMFFRHETAFACLGMDAKAPARLDPLDRTRASDFRFRASDFLFRDLFRASDFRPRTSDFSLWTSALSLPPSDYGIPAETLCFHNEIGPRNSAHGFRHLPNPS